MNPLTNCESPPLRHDFELGFALVAAHEVGLLTRLLSTRDTPAKHAAALALHERGCAKLLQVLVAAGFAEERAGELAASPALVALAAETPGGLDGLARIWGHLPTFLRTGRAMDRCDGTPLERKRSYGRTVGALGRMFASSAAALAAILAPLAPRTALDVGAGSGVWSLAVAQAVPGLQVTALDLGLDDFAERARALSLDERVKLAPQSFHEPPLGEGCYDLVMLAAVLHLEPPDAAEALVRNAAAAVEPGGHLVVVDSLEDGDAPVGHALYALNLALRSARAAPHDEVSLRSWLAGAGAAHVALHRLPHPSARALVARIGGA